MKYLIFTILLLSQLFVVAAKQSISRSSVAVIYNSTMPESKELAEFYASKRSIPLDNLIGLPLSKSGKISRKEYIDTLEKPLRAHFTDKEWWRLQFTNDGVQLATRNKIEVMVCMYGVPYGVNNEANLVLPEGVASTALTKQNCASVDSELAVLSMHDIPTYQPLSNKYFKKDSNFVEANTPFYMLVGRIDADSVATCKRMINDAIETEKTGLWGMAYLDLARKGAGYRIGDDWINEIEKKNWKLGIPTTIDKNKDTYLTNYPMKDVAMYFGWYTGSVNGPFINPDFTFRKGAVAVHLHSFSAQELRDPNRFWVGPLVAKGAAATVGNVYEPYLGGTHHFDILHDRLTKGYTLIESAYMSIPLLSWQNVVIGDPLYQPYKHLAGTGVEAEDDKFYRACNMAFKAWGADIPTMVKKLRSAAHKTNDARYFEVVGLFRRFQGKLDEANLFFNSAQKMYLLSSDKARNAFHVLDMMVQAGQKEQAIMGCKAMLIKIKDTPEAKTLQAMLNILSPPPPPPAKPNKEIPAKK
ncbi:MAG: TIGR03790 family protein [Akkermansiaceae bacterium]